MTATRSALFALLMLAATAAPAFAVTERAPGSIFDLPDRWDLSIYTLIVFVLLLLILGKFAWPAIMSGIQAREDLILNARDEAVKAHQEADVIRAELAAKMLAAHDDIRKLIEEARRDADKLRAVEREAGQKDAAAERERAVRDIRAAKEQAMAELQRKSVQLAALMAGKAIRREVTVHDQARLIDESLAELQSAN
jgi:F-type H+-transporting ATPase subunit b